MPVSQKRAFFLHLECVVKYATLTVLIAGVTLLTGSVQSMTELTDFIVNDDRTITQQSDPSIAVSGDGSFAITWVDRRSGTADIYLQRYDSEGNPVDYNTLVNDNDSTYQFLPRIQTDLFGRFSSVWIDYREGSYPFSPNIFMQPFDSAVAPVGPNQGVSLEAISSTKDAPDLSLSSWGAGVVVWADYRNNNWDIYGQLIASGGTLIGGNFLINDDASSAQQHAPRVSSSPEGWFVVTWYDNRLGDDDIFVQRFDSLGNRLGVNMKVNTDPP
ncbi:MAG: hypothetical protein P1R58_13055, partial [bacterium]|nr:hypothetical protein [bacterium]